MHLLVPFFVSLIISDPGLFRLVSFVPFMTFYTFFGEEEGLLLIGHIHSIQFIVDDGLVSSRSFKSLFPRTPRACLPLSSAGL